MTRPIVVVHIDKTGWSHYLFNGECDLYVVDERAPNDRIYRMNDPFPRQEIEAIIKGPIGHNRDSRHAAVSARINADLDGRPRLSIVHSDEDATR